MLEYLPSTTRATIIIIIELFWSLGSIFEYVMAMLIVPTHGWRLLTALSALPISILAMCMYVSMKYLILKINLFVSFFFVFSLYLNHLDILLLVVVQIKQNIF
jgi:MFS family permease